LVVGIPDAFILRNGIAHMIEIKTPLVNCRTRNSW
jgi:hypothetical protein